MRGGYREVGGKRGGISYLQLSFGVQSSEVRFELPAGQGKGRPWKAAAGPDRSLRMIVHTPVREWC